MFFNYFFLNLAEINLSMKKLILTGCIAMMSMLTQAQGPTDAISYLPHEANGFLILNKNHFSSVVRWKVSISTRTANVSSNTWTYNKVKSYDIRGTFYLMIEDQYRGGDHFVEIEGLNQSGGVVATQGPVRINPNSNPWPAACGWQCIGNTYAYGLELLVAPNNAESRIRMTNAVPPADAPYHYQWISDAHWNAFTQNLSNLGYYNIPNFIPNNSSLIKLTGVAAQHAKTDASGVQIHGTVYGVRKYYGPWATQSAMMESNVLTGGQSNCNQNFNWAMGQVNNNASIPSQLACTGISYGQSDGVYSDIESPISGTYEPCLEFFNDVWNNESGGNAYDAIDYISGCTLGNEAGTGTITDGFNWPENVSVITFFRLDSTGVAPIVVKEADLFNNKGEFVGSSIQIQRGLYSVGIQYADASYSIDFFEARRDSRDQLTDADFLGITAFPVPVINNQFSFQLNPTARVNCTYQLYDKNANLIFTKNYVLEKDANSTDLITVPGGIPSGILFNKFIFEDGSQINFQTVK